MQIDIETLDYADLKAHRDAVDARLRDRREAALVELQQKAAEMGFSMETILSSLNGKSKPKYRDSQGNTWSGRGKRPQWLNEALDQGQQLEEFAI